MCLSMILIYAHDMRGCSCPWKSALVCALLLCDKCTEMLPNSRVGRPWENANRNVIDRVHSRQTVARWRKRGDQAIRIRQEVGNILGHAGSYRVPVGHERCDTAMRTWIHGSIPIP